MLNTECKQCHKKWHHTNAKYCSICGKKLVEEPEFKSGDVVASQVFSDGSFSLVRLNKDLTNHLTPVDGFWYTKLEILKSLLKKVQIILTFVLTTFKNSNIIKI